MVAFPTDAVEKLLIKELLFSPVCEVGEGFSLEPWKENSLSLTAVNCKRVAGQKAAVYGVETWEAIFHRNFGINRLISTNVFRGVINLWNVSCL